MIPATMHKNMLVMAVYILLNEENKLRKATAVKNSDDNAEGL
jgi:hypothetical protein